MKITSLRIFALVFLCLSTSGLRAQNGPDAKARVGTTPRILADIETARAAKEKKLEAAFLKAIRAVESGETISPGRAGMVVAGLKASQAAWQEFRRKQCEFLYGYSYEEIGSLGARAAGIWEYESHLIDQRINELENPPNFF